MRVVLALLALCAILVAAGCGSGEVSAQDAKEWGKAEGVPENQPDRDR